MAEQAGRQGGGRKGSDPGGEPIAAGGKSVKATPGWLLGPDFGRAIPFQTPRLAATLRPWAFQSQGWSRVFAHRSPAHRRGGGRGRTTASAGRLCGQAEFPGKRRRRRGRSGI